MKCYCCGMILMTVADDFYQTVIPNAEIAGGKELICEDCMESVWRGSKPMIVGDREVRAFSWCCTVAE